MLYKRVEMELQFRDTLSSSTQPNGAVYVSYDEKPGIQAVGNIHPDRPPQQGKGFTRRDYEYKRHGTLSLLGDVNNETIGHANLKNRSERTESLKRK